MTDLDTPGAFYLGRLRDPSAGTTDEPLLYEANRLVTHAVCVGMTGSGKTGLCTVLLEEALSDGIPALVIDPKGDLANLLLTFPDLDGSSFEPWVSGDAAQQAGLTVPELAAREAERWRTGLAGWGLGPDRIQRLRDRAELALYTPGSTAGRPVNILRSFAAPSAAIRDDAELLHERVSTTATSVLGLVGLSVDPLKSREHILVARILETLWTAGTDVDLASLIAHVQQPPFDRVGALALDSFYPEKDRFELAAALNNLLAAPGFGTWLSGEPLDVGALLRGPSGRPRCAIFSIAHLNDRERMFFVALLLNEVLAWTRSQPGTTSLRAILYMDEIVGFFPPVANPPSKEPLLLLLKQARAYGLGVVLATQNPVDLDYKGLANTGTWLIGRLQTERDTSRVMHGLEGAAASAGGLDRQALERQLAGLGSRVFLLHETRRDAPTLFESRWALSYLCGPLTRAQIRRLTADAPTAGTVEARAADPPVEAAAPQSAAPPAAAAPAAATPQRPVLPPEIVQHFLPAGKAPGTGAVHYQPMILGVASVHFVDPRRAVDVTRDVVAITPVTTNAVPVDWARARVADLAAADLASPPAEGATFADLPAQAARPRSYQGWRRAFADWIYRTQAVQLSNDPASGQLSRPDEPEDDFRRRAEAAGREAQAAQAAALREKHAAKRATLADRLRRAEQRLAQRKQDVSQSGMQAAISVGATIVGAALGRRVGTGAVGRATTAARGAGRVLRKREAVDRAAADVAAAERQIAELDARLETEIAALADRTTAGPFETVAVRAKKTDIRVDLLALAWTPGDRARGNGEPA